MNNYLDHHVFALTKAALTLSTLSTLGTLGTLGTLVTLNFFIYPDNE